MFPFELKPATTTAVSLDCDSDHNNDEVINLVDSLEAASEPEITSPLEPEGLDPDPSSIEDAPRELFHQPQPPSKQQVLELFCRMPRALLRRMGGGDGVSNVLFVVGGANPRSASQLLNLCNSHPYFVKVVNRFLRAVSPLHKYSTFTIRRGCAFSVHRDLRNGPCPSLVLSLSEGNPGDGLLLHDKLGTVYKRCLSQDLPGVVIPLQKPFRFDARKVLHAGHVGNPLLAQDRIVLVAFTTLTARYVEPRVYATLVELGFPLPTTEDRVMENHANFGDYPRLRQLSVVEAFHLPTTVSERHDVIVVEDSQ